MSSFSIIGSGMLLLLLCFVCSSAAQDQQTEVELQNDLSRMEEIQELLRTAMSLLDPSSRNDSQSSNSLRDPNGASCSCSHRRYCTCCRYTSYSSFGLCSQCCAYIRYYRCQRKFYIWLKCANRWIISQYIYARYPRACASVTDWRSYGSMCVQLYWLKFYRGYATACPYLQFQVHSHLYANYNMGCFRMYIRSEKEDGGDLTQQLNSEDEDLNMMNPEEGNFAQCGQEELEEEKIEMAKFEATGHYPGRE